MELVSARMEATVSEMDKVCKRSLAAAQKDRVGAMGRFAEPIVADITVHSDEIQNLKRRQDDPERDNARLREQVAGNLALLIRDRGHYVCYSSCSAC